MDGLAGYDDSSDEEAVPSDTEMEAEPAPALLPALSGEIVMSPNDQQSPPSMPTPDHSPTGLLSSYPQSPDLGPGRITTSGLALVSYGEDGDRTLNDEQDESEDHMERQYDVTVENSEPEEDEEEFSIGKATSDGKVKLPPEPKGKCSTKIQEMVQSSLEKKKRGMDFSAAISNNKEFRNPSIYEKLIDMTGIDENGTNFSDPIFNKYSWKAESRYKALAEQQQKEFNDRESKKRKDKDRNDPNSAIKEQVIIEKQREQKEKRSKWDEQQAAVDKVNKANNIAAKLNAEMASKIHPPNLMKGKS